MRTAPTSPATISVVIASKGRPDVLQKTLASILQQTLQPEKIVVVVPDRADLPQATVGERLQTIIGPLGASAQRNAGIDAIPTTVDYIAFLDDDFEMKSDYLAQAVAFLKANASIVALSGMDLAGPKSVPREEALRMIANFTPEQGCEGAFISRGKHFILYGCNMVIRRNVLEFERFDENLPLYSFGEDYDLTMRLIRYGRVGRFRGSVGVHLQTKSGRVHEVQRGYSLVANPWYFLKKGTVHLSPMVAWIRFWSVCVVKQLLICLKYILLGNRDTDWSGRARGILLACWDILLGRSNPQRVRQI